MGKYKDSGLTDINGDKLYYEFSMSENFNIAYIYLYNKWFFIKMFRDCIRLTPTPKEMLDYSDEEIKGLIKGAVNVYNKNYLNNKVNIKNLFKKRFG